MRQTDVWHFAHLTSRPEPVYRLAEKEWEDFVEAFTDVLIEADSQIPYLPPKDVIHRVYRDVRYHTLLMLSPLIHLYFRSGSVMIRRPTKPISQLRFREVVERVSLLVVSTSFNATPHKAEHVDRTVRSYVSLMLFCSSICRLIMIFEQLTLVSDIAAHRQTYTSDSQLIPVAV